MKLALLLPGYLGSPEYFHMKFFDKRLSELGYTVERLDLCNLWETGNVDDYSVTNSLKHVEDRVAFYKEKNPEEIVLIGHSMGAFTAIIAGNRMSAVDKIVALSSPADRKSSAKKWVNGGPRVSVRELPEDPKSQRTFAIPYSYVQDASQYSAAEEVKKMNKPLMIFIGLDDTEVPPELTEKIVANANNPHVVRQPGIGHSFRRSPADCHTVMEKIEEFLKRVEL